MTETVKVEVELSQKYYDALDWYIRSTRFWISNDHEEDSIKRFCRHAIEAFIESEVDSGVPFAREMITSELKLRLDLED